MVNKKKVMNDMLEKSNTLNGNYITIKTLTLAALLALELKDAGITSDDFFKNEMVFKW